MEIAKSRMLVPDTVNSSADHPDVDATKVDTNKLSN